MENLITQYVYTIVVMCVGYWTKTIIRKVKGIYCWSSYSSLDYI